MIGTLEDTLLAAGDHDGAAAVALQADEIYLQEIKALRKEIDDFPADGDKIELYDMFYNLECMLVEAGDDDGAEAVALQAEELDLVEYEGESSAGARMKRAPRAPSTSPSRVFSKSRARMPTSNPNLISPWERRT